MLIQQIRNVSTSFMLTFLDFQLADFSEKASLKSRAFSFLRHFVHLYKLAKHEVLCILLCSVNIVNFQVLALDLCQRSGYFSRMRMLFGSNSCHCQTKSLALPKMGHRVSSL